MSQDEIVAIYKARSKAKDDEDKLSLEQTRLICFWNVVAINGFKTYKKPDDLFKLPWEKGFKVTSKEAKKELK